MVPVSFMLAIKSLIHFTHAPGPLHTYGAMSSTTVAEEAQLDSTRGSPAFMPSTKRWTVALASSAGAARTPSGATAHTSVKAAPKQRPSESLNIRAHVRRRRSIIPYSDTSGHRGRRTRRHRTRTLHAMSLARVSTAAAACVVLGAAVAACSGSFGSGTGLPNTMATLEPRRKRLADAAVHLVERHRHLRRVDGVPVAARGGRVRRFDRVPEGA